MASLRDMTAGQSMMDDPNLGPIHGHGMASTRSSLATEALSDAPSTNIDANLGKPEALAIPLICSVCPKTSKFSDVSHLLTHISSKGHLSNMFKLEIAKNTDDNARETLDEFNQWFEEYNLRDLLQNRNENRQSRGNRSRGSSSVSLRGGRGSLRVRSKAQSMTPSDQVKCEPQDDVDSVSDFTPSSHGHHTSHWHLGHGAQSWNNLPMWNGAYFGPGFQQGPNFDDDHMDVQPDALPDTDEGDDNMDNSSKYQPSDDDEEDKNEGFLHSEDTIDTMIDEIVPDLKLTGVTDDERERLHFMKYLKGDIAQLPGVGGFDAAPEEQRRKRNQKKDPSVIRQMQAASLAVDTTEMVFDLNFVWQRNRSVYDEPSVNGSEDEGDNPPSTKKAKRRSPRKKLAKAAKPRAASRLAVLDPQGLSISTLATSSRRGRRAVRGTQRTSTRASSSATASMPRDTPSHGPGRITRSARGGQSSSVPAAALNGLPGLVRLGSRVVDVFRDPADPSPGRIQSSVPRRPHNNISGLSLRPGNPNVSLLSPTPTLKRHTSARGFSGKENSNLLFQPDSTTSNPYLGAQDSLHESTFNPLCVPARGTDGFRGLTNYADNTKPFTSAFQPINGLAGYDPLHLASHGDDGLQLNQRHNNSRVYDM
ncbi:hypothetical protein JX265_009008 [Neoarthrinium moseri]|uniref:Uncharacterized protein n=1 Tax=Neoarthrinium moseri TaxID=1658444 RepID=A0A9P9WH48_9PEZI|nr:uncharacterized protein JN550_007878 [Neoarthrinium moseri]KAI1862962.1 hypothetical protein JX265_009008 [Neoarthrinium moseri]KAI1866189.1 hypothetical protein JN550_007878 [Neoarthrinium moseri]